MAKKATSITTADELWFLGVNLRTARLFAILALEAAVPLFRKSVTRETAVQIRFRPGTNTRDLVDVIVKVSDLRTAEEVLDQLRKALVSLKASDPAMLPHRVIGKLGDTECLRIQLNENGRLQIEVLMEARA